MDVHNGHEHDGLDYHYRGTAELQDDGTLLDVYPIHIGPSITGELPDDGRSNCRGNTDGLGGGLSNEES